VLNGTHYKCAPDKGIKSSAFITRAKFTPSYITFSVA